MVVNPKYLIQDSIEETRNSELFLTPGVIVWPLCLLCCATWSHGPENEQIAVIYISLVFILSLAVMIIGLAVL